MDKYVDEYLNYLVNVKHYSKNTMSAIKSDLKNTFTYLKEYNITDVKEISETNLNSYMLFLEKEKLASATISRRIGTIKAFFNYLILKNILKENPAERIKPPKVERHAIVVLTIKEMEVLLSQPNIDTSKGKRDKAILELLYATGMIASELVNLKMEDIDINNEFVVCGRDNKRRVVPFGKKAKIALEDYLNDNKKDNKDLIFTNKYNKSLSRQWIWQILRDNSDKAKIKKDITPNTIRHSFAAHLLQNGADIDAVEEMLGYSKKSAISGYQQANNNNHGLKENYTNNHPRA